MCGLLFGFIIFPAQAAFTSLYVFGDGVCTTTNGPGGSFYYGNRFSNGRVWVEVLAQRQGLTCESNKNWSYYGHYSINMVTNVCNFTKPADANTALYIVWACDADFVWNVNNFGTNIIQWTNSLNRSLSNHFTIITNLYYAKGARTLIMPNAVDLGKIPWYVNYAPAKKSFIRQQVMDFNTRFAAMLTNTAAFLPDLAIYSPDIFTFVDCVVANPANYGLIKSGTNAIADLPPAQWSLTGPGTNYVFWDDLDPTAMFHAQIADYVQQFIWPVAISNITCGDDNNRLDLVNVPIGRNGYVECSTNLVDWKSMDDFDSTDATQSVLVPASGPIGFYRLRLPFSWVWP